MLWGPNTRYSRDAEPAAGSVAVCASVRDAPERTPEPATTIAYRDRRNRQERIRERKARGHSVGAEVRFFVFIFTEFDKIVRASSG
jgi:hypothetical protein